MTPFLLALPWLGLLLFTVFVVKIPTELPVRPELGDGREAVSRDSGRATLAGADGASEPGEGTPVGADAAKFQSVSIIVPARNEAANIVACLESLAALEYPDFEIIVIDDRSEDDTGELARGVRPGNAKELVVVEGEDLPEGWLGKPWACWQGARRAGGDLLLFTDADTTHGPSLLARAVAGMREGEADLLTVLGRQVMGTFWERLVQPHIFLIMLTRYPNVERIAERGRWRDAIANGQYLLFRRSVYAALGGHESVRDEVVEDLALAQRTMRLGYRLRARSAEDDLATRMYRSLPHLIEGWSKNVRMGGLQSVPPAVRPIVMPLSILATLVVFVAPVMLALGLVAWMGGDLTFGGVDLAVGGRSVGLEGGRLAISSGALTWAVLVYALSAITYAYFTAEMRGPARYGLIYPLGTVIVLYIILRSWVRGRTVEWKGREYRLPPVSERA